MDKIRLSLFLCALGVVSATQVARSSSLNEQLLEAVEEGDCAVVERLLQEGANVHAATRSGKMAIHLAALYGYELVIDQLLRAGANVYAVDMYGDTALHLAARYAHEQVVERLLQAGADVRIADIWGNTALHMASNCAIVQRLVQAGADVNVANREGDTALHLAASYGHARVIDQLLRKDATIGAVNRGGGTALHLAALKGHESAVDWLLWAGANVNAVDVTGDTALHLAGNYTIAQRLVQAGADFEVLNSQQNNPLADYASGWIGQDSDEVIGYLISVGAGIDDLLHSDYLRKCLRPHVDLIKSRAAFLRDLLHEKQGVYSDLQGLIGQHAGFPISKQAVGKIEAILLRDLIENFADCRMPEEVVGKMEACLQ